MGAEAFAAVVLLRGSRCTGIVRKSFPTEVKVLNLPHIRTVFQR